MGDPLHGVNRGPQPTNLRVLSRQTIAEIGYYMGEDLVKLGERLPKNANPWSVEDVMLLEEFFSNASNRQGDTALWNRGGQGYRALKAIRAWLNPPAPDTLREEEFKVFFALLTNGVSYRQELLDACAPYDSENALMGAVQRLLDQGVITYKKGVYYVTTDGFARASAAIRRHVFKLPQ